MNLSKLNWLRAGVLGANDGIISIATLLIALVGNVSWDNLLIVALSATIAGALSMSIGEYISVSAQRDAELAHNYKETTNPYHAALSSCVSFIVGAIIPAVLAVLTQSIIFTVVGVVVALFLTGFISGKAGNVSVRKPVVRNLVAGLVALTIGVIANAVFGVMA